MTVPGALAVVVLAAAATGCGDAPSPTDASDLTPPADARGADVVAMDAGADLPADSPPDVPVDLPSDLGADAAQDAPGDPTTDLPVDCPAQCFMDYMALPDGSFVIYAQYPDGGRDYDGNCPPDDVPPACMVV